MPSILVFVVVIATEIPELMWIMLFRTVMLFSIAGLHDLKKDASRKDFPQKPFLITDLRNQLDTDDSLDISNTSIYNLIFWFCTNIYYHFFPFINLLFYIAFSSKYNHNRSYRYSINCPYVWDITQNVSMPYGLMCNKTMNIIFYHHKYKLYMSLRNC